MGEGRPILLLTRPEAASHRFAAAFRARFGSDWPVVIAPLMEIVALRPTLPEGHFDAVVFTSENAVSAYVPLTHDRSTPAWCVGERTAEVARSEGFSARSEGGDIVRLAQRIAEDGTLRRVLHPQGMQVAGDLEAALESAGIETVSVKVYEQRALPPPGVIRTVAAGATPIVLPLFSPASAALAGKALTGHSSALWTAAISDAAALAFPLPTERRVTARQKTADGMLAALEMLLAPR
ncbi:MAG: uroporphyrinogen-III synthase [Rhodobacteraceae bacterium]|nr:uroporphyrinogen-III synthase [Paracoccaceae bacterium]